MLLVVDVGNTNTVIGVYDKHRLVVNWRIGTKRNGTVDEYGIMFNTLFNFTKGLKVDMIDGMIISCVVPPIINSLLEMAGKYFGVTPLVVDSEIKTGLKILYENPREVGADRVVNAVAAFKKYGGPTIVVDFGTATTFCVISKNAEYLGGVIVPGIMIALQALFQSAAKLPRVELKRPETVLGRNTKSSMQSGIIFGYAGLVDGIISRLEEELKEKYFVVATGGLAEFIASETKKIKEVSPFLTLEGLKIIYEMNK
ncbi:MAG: pantothenate kinase [Candidatus Schekmanbacteria bacterium RBG_16_38_11]|uniref:Type III pantothenate kinase n=1 Tax=Candidatus Schekmanbacteria bacterium RBG_16_38_11 TaxID=1817880 RepID=A0A1F7RZ51_9BACT|nr:MAG: pantothenate kinase [Candidatus Schekmanbacteria bacterium RBG_16_38_11]